MPKTVALLAGYFNQGDGKRPLMDFQKELKVMTPEEKKKLAAEVALVTGQKCDDCDA